MHINILAICLTFSRAAVRTVVARLKWSILFCQFKNEYVHPPARDFLQALARQHGITPGPNTPGFGSDGKPLLAPLDEDVDMDHVRQLMCFLSHVRCTAHPRLLDRALADAGRPDVKLLLRTL